MPATVVRHASHPSTTPHLTTAATAILTSAGCLTLGVWLIAGSLKSIPFVALLAVFAGACTLMGAGWMRDHLHGRIPATRDTTPVRDWIDAVTFAVDAGLDTPGPITRPLPIPGLDGRTV